MDVLLIIIVDNTRKYCESVFIAFAHLSMLILQVSMGI